ncbi:hypothetical protein A2U01_0077043, partial [Trifolium medium]|nr:hypothetical protein [Trifolium medium]
EKSKPGNTSHKEFDRHVASVDPPSDYPLLIRTSPFTPPTTAHH